MGRRKRKTRPEEQCPSSTTQGDINEKIENTSPLSSSSIETRSSVLEQSQLASAKNELQNVCHSLEFLALQKKEDCVEKITSNSTDKSEHQVVVLPCTQNVCDTSRNTNPDGNNTEETAPSHKENNYINSELNLIKQNQQQCLDEEFTPKNKIRSEGDHVLNTQNQQKNKTNGIDFMKQVKAEFKDESQSHLTFTAKTKNIKTHKFRKTEKDKINECNASITTELTKTANEMHKIESTGISNSLYKNETHLESENIRYQKKNRSSKKGEKVLLPEMEESQLKKHNSTFDSQMSSRKEKLTCEVITPQTKIVSENLVQHIESKPELISQIKRHFDKQRSDEQEKCEEEGHLMSSACSSLSQEQITNITKTAANLNQSLGENEKLKISFTPELMHSLLSPVLKDVSTQEDELEYKIIQREIFLNNACHVCKRVQCTTCVLKRCNNCKMIFYCSKEHQRRHWPIHKDLCKAISKINKAEGMTHLYQKAIGLSPNEYRHYRIHYINTCANLLGRDLALWEKEMFFFSRVCHTCYEFHANKLQICEKCNHVCYCQPLHFKVDHENWCNDLQIYRDLIVYQFHNGMIQPHLPQKIQKMYIPLKGEMRSFLLNMFTERDKTPDMDKLEYVALTELATCPLSVLFALQQINFPLDKAVSLIIHVVGAELYFEGNVLKKWEVFLLHLLPSIAMLHVVFIGPEFELNNTFYQNVNQNMSCPECTNTGRKLTFAFFTGYYHDYVNSDQYKKPNLITAFNAGLYRATGFHGHDTWLPSIKVILQDAAIAIAVTEYTSEELPLDIKRMENICPLEVIVPPSKNPFSSEKPNLNFLSDEVVPVIFKNYYITVLHRK